MTIALEDQADLLGTITLLEALPRDVLQALACTTTRREYGKGTLLSGPGMVRRDVCFIIRGSVHCYRISDAGKEVQVRTFEAGAVYGLHHASSCTDDESYAEVASENTVLYQVPAFHFRAILASHAELALRVFDELVSRIRTAHDRIETLALYDVRTRVVRQLRRLAGPASGGTVAVTQQELAAMVGATREEVSKALRTLRQSGLVEPTSRPGTIQLAPEHVTLAS
jgi:CRP-like cAMP-binding protein